MELATLVARFFPQADSANMCWRAQRCHTCTELLRSLCIFASSSAALAVLSSKSLAVLTSLLFPLWELWSWMWSKVRNQNRCPTIPVILLLISSLQELLSHCIKQGAMAILSFTQQIHNKCSSAPVMVLASGDTVRNKTTCFPGLWGLYSSEEIDKHSHK